jgi:hypothetical protein
MWLHKLNLDTFSRGEIEISQNMKKKETGSKITFDPASFFDLRTLVLLIILQN